MDASRRTPSLPARLPRISRSGSWLLWGLIGLNMAVELVLMAADNGIVGSPRWRAQAYYHAAFWAGLLHDWRPNYAVQPWLMFLTYGFLHAGFWHMATNMLALWSLGGMVIRLWGVRDFVLIYFAAMFGGGLCFGLLSDGVRPMVGASGAIFGLIGAWQYRDWHLRRHRGQPLLRLLWGLFVFFLLNLVLWFVLGGQLAWETHLGGFVAGWLAAALLMRFRGPDPETGQAGRGAGDAAG